MVKQDIAKGQQGEKSSKIGKGSHADLCDALSGNRSVQKQIGRKTPRQKKDIIMEEIVKVYSRFVISQLNHGTHKDIHHIRKYEKQKSLNGGSTGSRCCELIAAKTKGHNGKHGGDSTAEKSYHGGKIIIGGNT